MRRTGRVIVLAGQRFWSQNMLHHAAALTYQSLLSVFQAMLLAVALLGLLGTSSTLDELDRFLTGHGVDPRLVDGLTEAGRSAIEARGASAAALGVAVVIALFVSSSAFVAASVALNVVVEARDERSIVHRRLHALGATLVAIVFGVGAVVAFFLGGGAAEWMLGHVGLGEGAAEVWNAIRIPLAAVLAMTGFAWMYYSAPTAPRPRWRWITLGAAVAVTVWLLASLGLFVGASSLGSFNATYGVFATAILLVLWLWIGNVALLFGAEVNAAGRYTEGTRTPLSRTGHTPEDAQHEAAKATAGVS